MRDRCREHAGLFAEAGEQRVVELLDACLVVSGERRMDRERDEMVRVEAWIVVLTMPAKPLGATPTTVIGVLLIVITWFRMDGSPAKRRCQNA